MGRESETKLFDWPAGRTDGRAGGRAGGRTDGEKYAIRLLLLIAVPKSTVLVALLWLFIYYLRGGVPQCARVAGTSV